jgi:copper transport protein
MRGFGRRLLLVLAVASVAVAGWAMPAFGHAELQSTDPASGTVLARSPGTVVLHFGEAVEIQFGAIRVFDTSSQRVDSGNAYHPNGDGRAVAINVAKNLPAGGYVVTWRVISADSHPVHGAFTFLVGADKATSAEATRAEAARLLATGGGSRTVGVLYGADRFASFMALFVLIGGAALVVGAWPEGRSEPRARRLLLAGLIGAIVTAALAIGLQGVYGGGLPLSKMVSPSVTREVLRTRFGEVYLLRLLILVFMAAPLVRRLFAPAALPRWWTAAGLATAVGLLVTPGLAGHAAAGSLVALAIPFDLVHLAGAAVWVGGLTMLGVAVLIHRGDREGAGPLTTVAPRFSQWALISVLAIAVSGGFAAWRQIGSLSAVTTTTFGRLVLAKTIIFVVLIMVALRSRRLVHGSLHVPFMPAPRTRPTAVARAGAARGRAAVAVPSGAPAAEPAATAAPAAAPSAGPGTTSPGPGAMAAPPTKRATWGADSAKRSRPVRRRTKAQRQSDIRKTVLVEVLLAAVIVAVSAVLVNAQPARQALSKPFSAEVHAGPSVLVDVVIDPAKAGPVAIHLYTLSADGAQLDVPEVTAAMSLASAGITNLTVPLQHGGTGHYLVGGFQVPVRGTWTLNITVRTSEFDEFNATPVRVRMR